MSLWQVMVEIIWFMVLVAWFWLLVVIIGDLFRDRSLSGFAKGMWCIFLIVVPWIGVLTYLLVRGHSMGERASHEAAENDRAFRAYVRDAAQSSNGLADELAKLADMRDRGVISPADYEAAKVQVLGGQPTQVRPAAS
jgi:hypothetical protein